MRQGCWATVLTWSRSRTRRGSGKASTLLSIVWNRARCFRFPRLCGVRRCASGVWRNSVSPVVMSTSFAWKAPSTRRASAAVSVFLSPRRRCAHIAASSPEPRSISSAINRSRNSAETSGARMGLLAFEQIVLLWPRVDRWTGFCRPPFRRRFLSPFGFPGADVLFVDVTRSGASRSSSPAIPTRVKRA